MGVARGVFLAVGFAALSDIKQDFIRKSRGEIGEDGVKWKPLSKEYLAYGRRFGKGEQAALKKAAGLGRANRFSPGNKTPSEPGVGPLPNRMGGMLTGFQVKRWWQVYFQHRNRLMLSMSPQEAKSRAAQIAWATIKREGAKTKLEVYGSRVVDINRDTGVLLNSLSPGELTGGNPVNYVKPVIDGGDQQVFEALSNGVVVGTNVAYAAAVNKIRPFIPKRIPEAWSQRWMGVANDAILIGARVLFVGA